MNAEENLFKSSRPVRGSSNCSRQKQNLSFWKCFFIPSLRNIIFIFLSLWEVGGEKSGGINKNIFSKVSK